MSRRKIPLNRDALIEALRECDGNQAAVARRFGCSRRLIWGRVNEDPELLQLVEELSESFIDEAENQLFEKIRAGDTACIIFFLKTKARHRGYSERLELIPLSRQDIEVELGQPTAIENRQVEALDSHGTSIALLEQ